MGGAVRANTVAATHMEAKANEPTASRATWGVKDSPNIHTLERDADDRVDDDDDWLGRCSAGRRGGRPG